MIEQKGYMDMSDEQKVLSKKQFEVLAALVDNATELSQREISTATSFSLGTVNKVMKELCKLGYVEDGRITIKGIEALEPYRVQRAVIIAAGFGSRLVPITLNTPKPLVRVHGKRIIDTLLDAIVAAEIPEIYIVRGYLAEQFDQLVYKYPMIKFLENPAYNEANNISSAMCTRYLLKNAYVCEADLLVMNSKLIKKYQYSSNFLGIPVDVWLNILSRHLRCREERNVIGIRFLLWYFRMNIKWKSVSVSLKIL